MAATKTRTAIWTAQVLTAGAANTTSSGAVTSLASGYGAQLDVRLTNGATGPTVAAQVQIVVGSDTTPTLPTNFGGAFIGSTANSAVSYFSVEIPIGVQSLYLVAGSNTAQNVTVDADISQVTAI